MWRALILSASLGTVVGTVLSGQQPTPVRKPAPLPPKSAAAPAGNAPASPALRAAADLLRKNLVATCANNISYVAPLPRRDFLDPYERQPSEAMYAVNSLAFRPVPWTITPADRLNHIDWIGELVLTGDAWRVASEQEWQVTHPRSHPIAEESRTRNAEIEGSCAKCVSVDREVSSFGAYHVGGEWHFFEPTLQTSDYGDNGTYGRAPARGAEIDFAKVTAPVCSEIPETSEYKEAERKAEEAAAAAEAEAKRQAAEAERQAAEAAELRRQQISAAVERSRTPQTDLERKTQSDGYWEDPDTGLIWLSKSSRQLCRNLSTAGESDWRIADVYEMQSLSDATKSHDLVCRNDICAYHIAGGILLNAPVIFASYPRPTPAPGQGRGATTLRQNIWTFDFRTGERSIGSPGLSSIDALCVRGNARHLKTEEGIVEYDSSAPAPQIGGSLSPNTGAKATPPTLISNIPP